MGQAPDRAVELGLDGGQLVEAGKPAASLRSAQPLADDPARRGVSPPPPPLSRSASR
ncbi:hypothetical protein GCM10010307_15130 [Streptomyces vastus]|uniref:Uncharacterized protein n=1 Tax=Streptomyces vastus TaxID=285451 RepID=A0ABN3QHS1_9ACTN